MTVLAMRFPAISVIHGVITALDIRNVSYSFKMIWVYARTSLAKVIYFASIRDIPFECHIG